MKFVVLLAVVACLATIDAKPYLGTPIDSALVDAIADRLFRRMSQSSEYARGKNSAAAAYDNAANAAAGAAAHDAGRHEAHDVGQHHHKVTQITQAEDSDSHNVGGSEAHDRSAAAGQRFNKHNNGAQQVANDYDQGRQESESI